jgi:rhodanese-related sulfurtransferase
MTTTITPEAAARMTREDGAVLIDIRDADEYAREHIPGARNVPLGRLDASALAHRAGRLVIHCQSGARTSAAAGRIAALAGHDAVHLIQGGLDAWRRAGLPVARDHRQPIALMRQVQIAAGSLVLAGVLLGALVAPGFFALSGLVGAGLVFAGISGTCGLAHLLRLMPWNRRAT